jgi:hypothetical protein
MGVDEGLRKLLTNASNSSELRWRACRAAWIDSRSRSSSASAAFSSNGWARSVGDTAYIIAAVSPLIAVLFIRATSRTNP